MLKLYNNKYTSELYKLNVYGCNKLLVLRILHRRQKRVDNFLYKLFSILSNFVFCEYPEIHSIPNIS